MISPRSLDHDYHIVVLISSCLAGIVCSYFGVSRAESCWHSCLSDRHGDGLSAAKPTRRWQRSLLTPRVRGERESLLTCWVWAFCLLSLSGFLSVGPTASSKLNEVHLNYLKDNKSCFDLGLCTFQGEVCSGLILYAVYGQRFYP